MMSPREQLNFLFKPLIMFSPIINILEQGVIFFPFDYQIPITPFSKIRWQGAVRLRVLQRNAFRAALLALIGRGLSPCYTP